MKTAILIVLVLFLPLAETASATHASGNFQLSFSDYTGNSSYTVNYVYPEQVDVGSNFVVQSYVHVDNLTGGKLYLWDYGLVASLSIPTGEIVTLKVENTTHFMYQGARWGPLNITIPMNRTAVGNLGEGQSTKAALSLQFFSYLRYSIFVGPTQPDSGEKTVGYVTITNPAASLPSSWFLIPVVITVVVVGGFLVRRRKVGRHVFITLAERDSNSPEP